MLFSFGGTRPLPVGSLGGSRFALNVGTDAKVTAVTSLFANAGYQVSTNRNITAYHGKARPRVAW